MKRIFQSTLRIAVTSFIAVIIAGVVCTVMLSAQGYDVVATFKAIVYGAVGNIYSVFSSVSAAMPLAVAGLGVAVAYKAGVYNIGAEGQLFVGGMCAAIVGTNFAFLPAFIHLPLCLIAGAAGGAAWAFIPALMKTRKGFNEVITTVLMNYIGTYVVSYATSGPMRPENSYTNQSKPILVSAILPRLVPEYELNCGLLLMLIFSVLVWFLINKSDWGYRIRAAGINPTAAQTFGINQSKTTMSVFLISGALAGLAGCVEVLGNQGVLAENFAVNMGYNAISVALLGGLTVPGTILSALFMGCLRNGGIMMQIKVGISSTFMNMLQAILILTVLCFSTVKINLFSAGKKVRGKS